MLFKGHPPGAAGCSSSPGPPQGTFQAPSFRSLRNHGCCTASTCGGQCVFKGSRWLVAATCVLETVFQELPRRLVDRPRTFHSMRRSFTQCAGPFTPNAQVVAATHPRTACQGMPFRLVAEYTSMKEDRNRSSCTDDRPDCERQHTAGFRGCAPCRMQSVPSSALAAQMLVSVTTCMGDKG